MSEGEDRDVRVRLVARREGKDECVSARGKDECVSVRVVAGRKSVSAVPSDSILG